jgi:hypothetical protein
MKFNKKNTDVSKSNMASSSNTDTFDEYSIEEKKLPLKPKPVKKVPVSAELPKEESPDLVIHSKEYQNKTVFDDVPEERA